MNEQINIEAPFWKQAIVMAVFLLVLIYGIISGVGFFTGFAEIGYSYGSCYKPRTRYTLLFPAYRLGCRFGAWMAEPVE